jgi:hypothetical protein
MKAVFYLLLFTIFNKLTFTTAFRLSFVSSFVYNRVGQINAALPAKRAMIMKKLLVFTMVISSGLKLYATVTRSTGATGTHYGQQ